MKKTLALSMFLVVIFSLIACSKEDNQLEGVYVTDDGMSYVYLYGDNKFSFNRHITTSHLPTGIYSVVNGRLILNGEGDEAFIFEIKDEYLVFIGGELPNEMIQSGTIFRLSNTITQVLTQGTYVTEDGLSSVTLHGDNEYIFNRHILTSYRPTGKYTILNNILTLISENDVAFIFHIDNGQLIFINGQLVESLIELGTIFKLTT